MSTQCEFYTANDLDPVLQGDIFRNISYVYKTEESEEYVDFTEFEFPYVIVLSQSCDISAMSKMIDAGGKSIKFMPSVLVAPIYDKEVLKNGDIFDEVIEAVDYKMSKESLFNSKTKDVIENDDHYRFHVLDFGKTSMLDIANPMIDFKHYFSVSPEYLNSVRSRRLCHLKQLNCEQITLRYAAYLSRVAFPEDPKYR